MESLDRAGLMTKENIVEFLMVSAALQGAPRRPGGESERRAAAAQPGAESPGGWMRQRGEQR
jgi:hypothetical protein